MREDVFFRRGALRYADILGNARIANILAEPLFELIVNLVRHVATTVKTRHDAAAHHALLEHVFERPQGLLNLEHAMHGEISRGNRNQHAIGSEDGAQAQHAENRATVQHDGAAGVQVFLDDSSVQSVKDVGPFAELGIDLGQLDVCGNDQPAASCGTYQLCQRLDALVETKNRIIGIADATAANT